VRLIAAAFPYGAPVCVISKAIAAPLGMRRDKAPGDGVSDQK
jgi:hypothetical protein